MLILLRSKIFLPSAIDGAARRIASVRLPSLARSLSASVTVRLAVLVAIFVALPIVLYGQFENVDRRMRDLVVRSIQSRSWLIAQALRPVLDRGAAPAHGELNAELRKYSADGTDLKLMLRPAGANENRHFYYVAAAPEASPGDLGAELDSLTRHGVIQSLGASCSIDSPVEIRYRRPDGRSEILTSVMPIRTRWGCWALVSSHPTSEFLDTSIVRPYWQTPDIRLAAVIYLAAALFAAFTTLSVWRNIRHFRDVAREVRRGRIGPSSFSARNVVPEFASVAGDFDQLVIDLHNVASDIRRTAEDNAHSFKAPLATIQSSLQTLKRFTAADGERARRALALIEASTVRLGTLITAAQRLDHDTADLIDTPREPINLTDVVADVVLRYRDIMAERSIRLARHLDENVVVHAGKGALDVVVENILDNAISFSPSESSISVTLTRRGDAIDLLVEDEGPGIDPKRIDRIFDRYFSLRPQGVGAGAKHERNLADHAGLGLWIVRRNIEAMAGKVTATNRVGGGLSVRVTLPTNGS
jgi:two-component system, OmpR family, sensor histidine kinase ChvG